MAAHDNVILVDTSGSAVSVTLPSPTNGRVLKIKDSTGNAGTNNITILPFAAELIDGSSSKVISFNYGSANLVSDGTNWFLDDLSSATGSGTVTTVSVVSANGLAGTVANPTSTPAITLSTTVTGVLKGNGTAISAATAGTDYVIPSGSITGTSSNVTASSNSTLTTLSALSLPYSQVTGAPAAITALTGDGTASGPGSAAFTLSTVNSNTGSFGSSTAIPNFTVNAKGLITAAGSSAVVAPAGTLTGTTLASNVVTSSLTSLGIQSAALNMGSNQINSLASPSLSTDAANKGYVDAAINGLTWKGPVQAYANSNVPLTGSTPLVIDGYTVLNNDLLILGNQTTASQNGEYTAAISGGSYTLTANGQPTAAGDAWLVLNGTTYANSAFVATSAVPTAAFVEFAGPTALIFTAPLVLTGNTVSITQATTSTNGYLSSTDWNTFNNKQPAGSYITALTGDVTASGPGSSAATVAKIQGTTVSGTTGSGNVVFSASPTLTGTITAAAANFSGAISASNFSGSSSGTNTGDVTLTAFGSSPNADGASLSGQALTLQPADATHAGGVSITTQTFAGDKTLTGNTLIAQATASQATIGLSGSTATHQINGGINVTTNTVSTSYAIS